MSIHKILDEATRINGTGNVKNALTKIIEAIRTLAVDEPREAAQPVKHAPLPAAVDSLYNPPAPEKAAPNVYYVDVGDMTPERAKAHIESIKKGFSEKRASKPVTITKSGEPKKKPGPKPKNKEPS
jgi:hypothetical protein